MVDPKNVSLRSIWLPLAMLLAAIAILLLAPPPAAAQQGPGAILIWPVNPVIEADRQAGALWLENPGKTPVTLQVRVYAWAQADGKNVYAETNEVVGTPPIVTIAPGEKQLVRLTRTGPAPRGFEVPYRLIVDEIPAPDADAGKPGASVAFRMRYSLPLFAIGASAPRAGGKAPAPAPALGWRIVGGPGEPTVEIRNDGPVHARLTAATLGDTILAPGLLGYVLPGQVMRWPLPSGAKTNASLAAAVNGAEAGPIMRLPD